MNKFEFNVHQSSTSVVYMSSVLQYQDTTNNRKCLVFASKERNHIYITRQSLNIESVSITFGAINMENMLTIDNATLFIDISELLAAYEGKQQTMTLRIKNSLDTEIITFYVIVAKGYRYDRLAQNAQVPYIHSCDNVQLSTFQYDSKRTLTFALPPTTIIAPINEEGLPIFQNIENIELPFWRSHVSPSTINVKVNNNIISTANVYGLLKIRVEDLLTYGTTNASLYGGNDRFNTLKLQKMQDNTRYICVKWRSPYITTLYFTETSGDSKLWYDYTSPQIGVAFFEIVKREINTDITELEGTASYMPYVLKQSQTITIGMRNITAYDYVYYSQILFSEEIEIIDTEYFPTDLAEFQPVRLKKSKITMPQSGAQLYNLEIDLIIEQ
jgi:hypothetical protein